MLWAGQLARLFGFNLAGFALTWHLTKTTGSPTVLAVGMLMTLLPQIILGPFAGAVLDRWDRRRTMIVAHGFHAAIMAGLAASFVFGGVPVWHIYGASWVAIVGPAPVPIYVTAPICLLVAGRLTAVIGVRSWYLIGGVAYLIAGVGARAIPAMMRVESASPALSGSGASSETAAGGGT